MVGPIKSILLFLLSSANSLFVNGHLRCEGDQSPNPWFDPIFNFTRNDQDYSAGHVSQEIEQEVHSVKCDQRSSRNGSLLQKRPQDIKDVKGSNKVA